MTRILLARILLTLIGAVAWGYGYRTDVEALRLAGLGIVAVALLLRFIPHRWLGEDNRA